MGLLDRFLGSDKNLRGPNFETAPWLEIDFSGIKLRFKDPQHTAMFPIEVFAENADIYLETNFEKNSDQGLTRALYKKGWELKGSRGHSKGGVNIFGFLSFFTDQTINCFDITDCSHEIIKNCHYIWGSKNKGATLGDLGYGKYTYPTHPRDIKLIPMNNNIWYNFNSRTKGLPPRIGYACPISAKHILFLDFTLSAYHEVDFYSPTTNLEQASHKLVEDFMSHFHIELSSEAKAQQAAATDQI